ncbi:hypothetical protein FKG94_11775 [Exilibacterium tricleocarpae]|uniref:Serine aminopeptidase S33 domain-containing protein n=1 Tax=Exilibacterium tricleocarpae TaxID=2591008 RepID=A0A545TNG0_9GAMM|nr:alpha/beta fold hydrolase [Exilibacterium tricleocarpae]TQV78701.1 hypothetical protein FKG94_11775 [Exilibacterium tricleocarpae]
MQTINWQQTQLELNDYRVNVTGGHQLQLKQCYRQAGGPPVLLLAGFLNDASLFFTPVAEGGLAQYLAAAGFDVYVAELRGKGGSWPAVNRKSETGLHEAITEDLPAHIDKIAQLRPGEPQCWIGEGLGSVLLAATYARLEQTPAPVLGMAHFAAGRYCELTSWPQTLAYMTWQWRWRLSSIASGYIKRGWRAPTRESRVSAQNWQTWQQQVDWCDPVDGFDYRRAIRRKGMPPSLYFAARNQILWGALDSTRLWIRELGNHDARLLGLGKASGNLSNYSARTMVTSAKACEDHFPQLLGWLRERGVLWQNRGVHATQSYQLAVC